jgi:carbon starvation protein
MGKKKYAWVTAVPMCFVGVTTLTAGVLSIKTIYWPLAHQPGTKFQGYLNSLLMVIFIVGVVVVVFEAGRRCWRTLRGEPIPHEAFGKPEAAAINMSCC